jgi:hypothetical protein
MLEETSQGYSFFRQCVGKPRRVIRLKTIGSLGAKRVSSRNLRPDSGRRADRRVGIAETGALVL